MNPFYEGMVKVAADGGMTEARGRAERYLSSPEEGLREDTHGAAQKWHEAHEEIDRQLGEARQEGAPPENIEFLENFKEHAAHKAEAHGALGTAISHVASGGKFADLPIRHQNMAVWGLEHMRVHY